MPIQTMRDKNGKFIKGHLSFWKGRKHSEESKRKMSIAQKGKKCSEETKRKLSISHKGYIAPKEQRKKMSESLKYFYLTHTVWNKGKTNIFSKETIEKMRISQQGKKHPSYFGKLASHWKGGKKKIVCIICNKIAYRYSCYIRNRSFCSKQCYYKYHSIYFRGEEAHHWKGGITPLHIKIRNLIKNKKWIRNIYLKDNYICQQCGVSSIINKDLILIAHHKIPFNKILQEFLQQYSQFSPIEDKETLVRLAMTYDPFWDIDNGQTLCECCHKKTYIEIYV